MIYIYGIILALLIGLSNSFVRNISLNLSVKKYLVINSWLNLILTGGIYFLFFRSINREDILINNINIGVILLLGIYLLFRILSNVSQVKLNSHKNINVNILNIVLSCMFFLTIAIDMLLGSSYEITLLLGFIFALIGIIVITVDLKNFKFYFNRKEIILLVLAFLCAGTKPVMAKYLLNYISFSELAIIECLNYAIIYSLFNILPRNKKAENNKISKSMMINLFLLSLISAICITVQYKVFVDIKIYILTSFLTPIFTALFAYIINKEKINRKTAIGIFIIVIGIIIAKISM